MLQYWIKSKKKMHHYDQLQTSEEKIKDYKKKVIEEQSRINTVEENINTIVIERTEALDISNKHLTEQKKDYKELDAQKKANSKQAEEIEAQKKMITSLKSNLETQRNENGKLSDVSKVTAGKINNLEQDLKTAKKNYNPEQK